MSSPLRRSCDECKSIEMVLQELDYMAIKAVAREREMMRLIVE